MDKCVSLGLSMVNLGTRYTFKFLCDYLFFRTVCRKQCCRSWCTAVYVSSAGFHLGMILCWLLNMQCNKMQDFPFDLVFHAVIRTLKCKAVLNVKKGISTFCFCIYLVLCMIACFKYCYLCHSDVCRHLNTINSACFRSCLAELYATNSCLFPLYVIL